MISLMPSLPAILLALMLGGATGKAQVPAQVTLQMYDLVFVTGGRVTLGQIAQIKGDPEIVARLENLQIGRNLKRRESRIVTIADVRRALPEGIQVYFSGAPAVEVRPSSPPAEFCDLVPAIQRRYALLGGDSITVICSGTGQGVVEEGVPPVHYCLISPSALLPGKQIVTLQRQTGDGETSRLHGEIQIQLFGRLAMPVRHIQRGQFIQAQDFVVQTVDLATTGTSGLLYQPANIVGWEAVRHISPDSPLRWDHVKPPALVRKGDDVRLLLGADNFQIKATATALENGRAGEKIWIRLENNGKRMRAVVLEGGCVALE